MTPASTPRAPRSSALPRLCCALLLAGASLAGADSNPDTAKTAATAGYAPGRWWAPGEARPFPTSLEALNSHGTLTTIRTDAAALPPDTIAQHPFFAPLGANGRACITCHQPSDGMSLSVATIRERWLTTNGTDPLFAPIDGANCPDAKTGDPKDHSLLLDHGLFRIFRPWPPRDAAGKIIEPQFDIEVVRDPTGCNTHPQYGLRSAQPAISVYRRPRPAANLKYATAVGFPFEPKNGLPLPLDPATGERLSGNLMSDGRNATLRDQATEAARIHLQMRDALAPQQVDAIVAFENTLFTAQSHDPWGGALDTLGAQGGPAYLAKFAGGKLQSGAEPIWSEFKTWLDAPSSGNAAQDEFRRSVARGAQSFATKTFLVWDSAGVTSMGFGNPVRNTCAFCHNMQHVGLDVAPGQVDLGTTNEPFADPAPHLPLFKLTCKPGYRPHPHLGRVVYTSDPGFALTTGRCLDIGKITIQQMRGLAARAPYFSNGSARTLRDIVEFYDRRYNIGYTEQEKQDLVNLMSVL